MNLKSVICRGQARTIEDALAVWKADHEDAAHATAAAELVDLYLAHGAYLRSWTQLAWELLFDNRIFNPQIDGETLQQSLVRALDLGGAVAACLRPPQAVESDIAEKVHTAAVELQRLSEDLQARWPWLDEHSTRRALADYQAGRYRPVKDMIDELRRPGVGVR